MTRKNALWNCKNPYQGTRKRILCVCSAGLLRSPTLADELTKRNYNTRAVGVHDYALIKIDEVLIEWADVIIAIEDNIKWEIEKQFPNIKKVIVSFGIPDTYEYQSEELVAIINKTLDTLEY